MLLSPLPELEFEFVGAVDALLNDQGIHGVDGRTEALIPLQAIEGVFV